MKIKHTEVCLPVLLILLSGSLSFGQRWERHETSASRVVWHFVARSLVNQSNGTSQVVGYFTDLDGVSGSLFYGAPSESTAFLTLRTDLFTLEPLPINGNIPVSVPGSVTLHLYFNPTPSNSWNDRTISVGGPGNTHAFPFVATGIAIGNGAKNADEN
jgi:hypothetical protein